MDVAPNAPPNDSFKEEPFATHVRHVSVGWGGYQHGCRKGRPRSVAQQNSSQSKAVDYYSTSSKSRRELNYRETEHLLSEKDERPAVLSLSCAGTASLPACQPAIL